MYDVENNHNDVCDVVIVKGSCSV